MARKTSGFKVGLFVITGVIMAVGAITYLGAARYLDKANTYVSYFSESVQGLQRDSVVKYLGVNVGRVSDIQVAPDYNLIEVIMDIDFEGNLSQEMVAQLKSAGITGITFIELTRRKEGEKDDSPKINFPSEYPIIPSKPSEISRFFSMVDHLAKQIQEINFKSMADKLDAVLTAAHEVLNDERVKSVMAKMEDSAVRLQELMAAAQHKLSEFDAKGISKKTDQLLIQGNQALATSREVLDEALRTVTLVKQEIERMNLPVTVQKTNNLIDQVDIQAVEFGEQMRVLSLNLIQATRALEKLLSKLEQSPSQIMFSQPPPPRKFD